MTGKHRDYIFKPGHVYSVGTKLKLEKILREDMDTVKHLVRVSAKKGNTSDVYILYAKDPSEYLGELVEVEKVDKNFMRNTYYLRAIKDAGKVRRSSY